MGYPTGVIYINHDDRYRGHGDYIDAEVIDVVDGEPTFRQAVQQTVVQHRAH